MMRFEPGLEKPDPRRALASAVTIAGAYIAGDEAQRRTFFGLDDRRKSGARDHSFVRATLHSVAITNNLPLRILWYVDCSGIQRSGHAIPNRHERSASATTWTS